MKSRFASILPAALSAIPSLRLLLAVVIGWMCLNVGNSCRAQVVLINGANQTGTIYSNTVADSCIFTANVGEERCREGMNEQLNKISRVHCLVNHTGCALVLHCEP